MTSATLGEHIAMLNAANLKPGEAEELGQFFALDLGQREDYGWRRSEVATRLGLNPAAMPAAQRLTLAAAALMIAAEDAQLTPFDRWLRSTYTRAERARFNGRDVQMMRNGFEGAHNG